MAEKQNINIKAAVYASVGLQDWVKVVCGLSSGTLSHVRLCARGARCCGCCGCACRAGLGFCACAWTCGAGDLGFLQLQLRLEDEPVGSLLLVGADGVDDLVVVHGASLPCGA